MKKVDLEVKDYQFANAYHIEVCYSNERFPKFNKGFFWNINKFWRLLARLKIQRTKKISVEWEAKQIFIFDFRWDTFFSIKKSDWLDNEKKIKHFILDNISRNFLITLSFFLSILRKI